MRKRLSLIEATHLDARGKITRSFLLIHVDAVY